MTQLPLTNHPTSKMSPRFYKVYKMEEIISKSNIVGRSINGVVTDLVDIINHMYSLVMEYPQQSPERQRGRNDITDASVTLRHLNSLRRFLMDVMSHIFAGNAFTIYNDVKYMEELIRILETRKEKHIIYKYENMIYDIMIFTSAVLNHIKNNPALI